VRRAAPAEFSRRNSQVHPSPRKVQARSFKIRASPSKVRGCILTFQGAPSKVQGCTFIFQGSPLKVQGCTSVFRSAPSLRRLPPRVFRAADLEWRLAEVVSPLEGECCRGAERLAATPWGFNGVKYRMGSLEASRERAAARPGPWNLLRFSVRGGLRGSRLLLFLSRRRSLLRAIGRHRRLRLLLPGPPRLQPELLQLLAAVAVHRTDAVVETDHQVVAPLEETFQIAGCLRGRRLMRDLTGVGLLGSRQFRLELRAVRVEVGKVVLVGQ